MDAAAASSRRYVGRDSSTTYGNQFHQSYIVLVEANFHCTFTGPNSTFHFTTIINDTGERDSLQKETLEAQSKKVDENIQQGAQDRERLKREFDTAANGSTLYTLILKLVNPFGWGALWDALWAVYTGQGRAIDNALGREADIARNLSGTIDASQENIQAILALLGAVLSAQRKAEADMIEARRQLMAKVIEIQGLEEADKQSYKQRQSEFVAQAEVEKQKQEQAAADLLIAELRERERQRAQEKEQYEKADKEAKEVLKEAQKTNLDAKRAMDKILKEKKALQKEKEARIEREKQKFGWLRSILICFGLLDDD
jgi:hypothetical protein